MMMIFALHLPGSAAVIEFVPMQNRGALAWVNVAAGDDLGSQHPEVSRLLAHAGADKTELTYIATALKFKDAGVLRWRWLRLRWP